MDTGVERDRTDESDHNPVVSLLLAIRNSFIAFTAAFGIVCLLLAVFLSEYISGISYEVLSAMFAVWGVSALVYACLGYVVLRLIGYH
jgi:hypothetical protein